MASADEDLTPITCSRCGSRFTYGTGADAAQCPICKGRDMRPSQWKRSTERALTASGFVTVIEDIMRKLRERPSEGGALLIGEGSDLLATFRSWEKATPEDRARSRAIDALADWHKRANDLLKR